MRKRSNHIAPDRPGTTITREAHCMDCMPGHQGFFHISLALITSRANKRGGVIKYVDNTSVCSVKNHIIRPADLWGEVINDANRGNHLAFLFDLPDFGNYEAGAN